MNANISMTLLYSGLFLSPLLLVTKLASPPASPGWRWASTAISLLFVLISAFRIIHLGIVMPIGGNVFIPEGIGPLTLRDTYILHQSDVARLPVGFWIAVTSVGLLGQFLLVQRIVGYAIAVFGRRRGLTLGNSADVQPLMALMTAAIYCAPVTLIPMNDRYLVLLAPLLAYWLLATARPAWTTALAPALSVLVCTTSAAIQFGTHDYLAWNCVRWQALTYLERSAAADFLLCGWRFRI